jgi:hypothetical protein
MNRALKILKKAGELLILGAIFGALITGCLGGGGAASAPPPASAAKAALVWDGSGATWDNVTWQ